MPAIPGFGTSYRYHITGLFHDETVFQAPTLKWSEETERLVNKVESIATR